MLWRSSIQTENHDKPTGFQPQTQQAQAGDAIFWVNEDVDVRHQPYPAGGQHSEWCANALTGSERTDAIALADAGTIEYLCAIHPKETGTIVVSNAVGVGRTADGDVLFIPATLPINTEQSVSWSNSDSEPHQPAPIEGTSTQWFAEPIPSGEVSAPVAFPTAGNFAYRCVVPGHEGEVGSIVVTKPKTT